MVRRVSWAGIRRCSCSPSGSVYSTGPLAPWEQSYPFLQTAFGMLGFDSTDIVRAEGTMDPNIGPDVAVERACAELEQKLPEFLA